MGDLTTYLVVAAVAAWVVSRQFAARKVTWDRKAWLLPVVLACTAITKPDGLLDPAHRTASLVLVVAGTAVGLLTGAGLAWTMCLWTGPDGAVWGKGRAMTAVVWVLGIAVRLGLLGTGALLGVHLGSQATTLGIAAVLLAQSGALALRAGAVTPAYGVAAAK